MTPIRVAAILFWANAVGFGLSVIPVARHLIVHRELPTVPIFGFRVFGGGFFERFGIVPFVWLLMAFLGVCAGEAVAGWLLWSAQRSGGILALALLPVGAVFWFGFALPLPPINALIRTALLLLGWSSPHRRSDVGAAAGDATLPRVHVRPFGAVGGGGAGPHRSVRHRRLRGPHARGSRP